MEIVEGATDWDRCWVLDTDQLALDDLAELNDEAFGSAWMIARSTCTAGAAAAGWFGHGWPAGAPGEDDRMPYSGALLNLAAMRKGGFSGTFRHAVEAWGVSEQLATSIAVRGRFNEAAISSLLECQIGWRIARLDALVPYESRLPPSRTFRAALPDRDHPPHKRPW